MREQALIAIDRFADGYAVITMNRPERLNMLSVALRRELAQAVRELEADAQVHVLILTGAGRAFSAGLDITEWDSAGSPAAAAYVHDPVEGLGVFSGPVIGAINGLALTGGLELSLACDFLIAAEDAQFADTHCHVGLLPGWGGSVRLQRRVGIGRAMEMALTGRFVSAQEALAWGLVNHVVPAGALLDKAAELARQMVKGVPAARARYKKLLLEEQDLPFQEALRIEREASVGANVTVTSAELKERLARLKGRG